MGSVLDVLANNPLRAQAADDTSRLTQAQVPLVNAQAQLTQTEAAKAQQALKDQQILSQSWVRNGGDFDATVKDAKANGLSFDGYVSAMNDHLGMLTKYAQNTKAQNEAMAQMHEQYGQLAESVLDNKEGTPQREQSARSIEQQLHLPVGTLSTDFGVKKTMADNMYLSKFSEDMLRKQQTDTSASQQAEAEQKTATAKRNQDIQELSGAQISDQASLDAFRESHPGLRGSLPGQWSPAGQQVIKNLIRSAVPIPEQPEYNIKTTQSDAMAKLTPQDWDSQVDSAIDPKQFPDINSSTKALVRSATGLGLFNAAQMAIKDGADKAVGRNTSVVTARNTAPFKIQVAAGEAAARAQAGLSASGLNDEDFQRLGQQYHDTGVMPPMGMGNAAVRGRILHESNQIAAQKGESPADVTAQQTMYQTGKMDLASQQKLYSQVKGFEDTAGQNLDRALKAAGSVVDSGSPLFNAPLRSIAGKLGSKEQAAFNAAITTAQNEVARVLNSATASGGVVSDHAKQEVTSMLSGDYSLSQLQAAANILRQDMHTRTGAIQQQIQDQQKRMLPGQTKTPAGATYTESDSNLGAPGPLPATLSGSDVGKVYTNRTGQRIKITAVNPNNPKQFRSEVQQ